MLSLRLLLSTMLFTEFAKKHWCVVILIGHCDKSGNYKGPSELVHEVDDITADGKITKEEIEHLRNKIKMLERIAAEKQQQ